MIRVIAQTDIKAALQARGFSLAKIARILKHGPVKYKRAGLDTWDVLIDRDIDDFPQAQIDWLLSQPAVLYVAEWELNRGPTFDTEGVMTDPGYTVLKGTTPTVHGFFGWPC